MFKKLFDSKFMKWVRYLRQQLQNQRENREQIGEDRDGNKYYQYYSYWGLPTRRQIRFKEKGNFDMKDLVYYQWLHQQTFDPPTQAEKQLFYLQQKKRYQRALAWDQKQKQLSQQFRQKRLQLGLRDQALAELERQLQAKSQLTDIKTKRIITNQQSTTKDEMKQTSK